MQTQAQGLPLDDLLAYFGATLVNKGAISSEQLAEAEIIRAETPYVRVGEILLALGYIRLKDYAALMREHLEGLRLGDYLVLRRIVSREQLQDGLRLQAESGKMLGHCLITLGHCSMPVLQRALAEQRALRGQTDE